MRSVFTGTLGVATLVLPVKLGTVASDDDAELHRYRKSDASRIRMKRVAEADGEPVEYSDTQPGYELPDGTVVLLGEDDLRQAFGEKSKEVKILQFTAEDALPRTAAGTSYYVEPKPGGEKAYTLLALTMAEKGKAAVVTFMLRDRQAYGLLYTNGDGYLILEKLNWASSVKQPDFKAPDVTLSAAELDLMDNLVTQMTAPWDWSAAKDEGAARLAAVIQGKAETGQAVGTPAAKADSPVTVDLAAALTASVAAARAAKDPAPVRTRAPRRKAVA